MTELGRGFPNMIQPNYAYSLLKRGHLSNYLFWATQQESCKDMSFVGLLYVEILEKWICQNINIASYILITCLLRLSMTETKLLQQICQRNLKFENTLLDGSLAPTSTVDGSFIFINCKTLTNNVVKWYSRIWDVIFFNFFLNIWNHFEEWKSTFVTIALSWNSSMNVLYIPHLPQPLIIMSCMFLICVHALWSHSQISGFKLLILESTSPPLPSSIWVLICDVVHLWNYNLNVCFKGLWRITSTSCSFEVQLA